MQILFVVFSLSVPCVLDRMKADGYSGQRENLLDVQLDVLWLYNINLCLSNIKRAIASVRKCVKKTSAINNTIQYSDKRNEATAPTSVSGFVNNWYWQCLIFSPASNLPALASKLASDLLWPPKVSSNCD